MKRVVIRLSLFAFLFFLLQTGSLAKPRDGYGKPLGMYKGEKGVSIVSYSYNWVSEKSLKAIYNELLKNFHGEEIYYLSNIYIYPDSPDGITGSYYEDYEINSEGKYVYKDGRYIEIFNGNKYTDVSQFAEVLSHEYGHHFTLYYLLTKENKHFNQWKDTKYAQIRGLKDYKEVEYFSVNDRSYIHKWDVSEIAAEDYVQLFGSPNAKKSTDYKDVQERVEQNIKESSYSSDSFNLIPQENLSIPLAADVHGLYLYWLELAGYTSLEPRLPEKPKLTIKEHKEIMPGHLQYEVTWDPISDNKSYEYTLVTYPSENNIFPRPVKTVQSGEKMKAYIGSAISNNRNGTTNMILDDQYVGEFYFRLFIKDQRGFMFSTVPIKYNFDSKQKNSIYRMTDIPSNHWALSYIETVVDKKIAEGYEDGTFRPENKVTKAEFMAMLMRAINYKVNENQDRTHWFEKTGYFEAAQKLDLINTADYGTNYNNLNYDEPITREEVSFMSGKILKYLGCEHPKNYEISFKDTDAIKYKDEFILVTYYYILNGYPDGTFKPSNDVTRAEASKVIYKILDFVD